MKKLKLGFWSILAAVFGVLVFISSVSLLFDGKFGPFVVGLIIAFLLFLPVLLKVKKYKAIEKAESGQAPVSFTPAGCIFTQVVGCRFECKFPSSDIVDRKEACSLSENGDHISLVQYDWNGGPAFAVISDKLGVDLGVVPATAVNAILNSSFRGGVISNKHWIHYDDEEYFVFDLMLND